jgi:hypothetical protein
MSVRWTSLVAIAAALSMPCFAIACSTAPGDSRIGIVAPDRTTFDPVGNMLGYRCGNLDCHGNKQRNLVIWGSDGLRLDPTDAGADAGIFPGGNPTTEAELDATYRSLVGLEPALMSQVIKGKGLQPELLTFVRKARGEEAHKGGTILMPGDDGDQCIALWLAGHPIDDLRAPCRAAMNPPGADAGM